MDSHAYKNVYFQKSMRVGQWSISGYSRAGFRTGFYVHDLNLMLDGGPHSIHGASTFFITHTHTDHIANLPYSIMSRDNSTSGVHIYVYCKAAPYLQDWLHSTYAANWMQPVDNLEHITVHECQYNSTFNVQFRGTRSLRIETFELEHRIPAMGYGLSEVRQKLLPEYTHLSGKEIAALKKNNTVVTGPREFKLLAYVCDTTARVFELNPTLLDYATIMVECTFLEPDEHERARETMHVHWDELKPYVVANPHTKFILFHFSMRYTDDEIREFFTKQALSNVTAWI